MAHRSPEHLPSRVMPLLVGFFVVGMFTVSFDVFLTVDAGFTVRATHLLWLVPMGVVLSAAIVRSRVPLPIGFTSLLAWAAVNLFFLANSGNLVRGVAYELWLLYNIFLLPTAVLLFGTRARMRLLVRWYVISFVVLAAAGLVQFALAVTGLAAPFVTQWWVHGQVPRINGLSYEPSYYGTYLLTGWVLVAYLLERWALVFRRITLIWMFALLSLALVLSSSRMVLAFMLLYMVVLGVRTLVDAFQGRVVRVRTALAVALLVGVAAVVLLLFSSGMWRTVLVGTGLAGTPDHSSSIRLRELHDTFTVFAQSPLVGYSLGGVAPAIARLHGVTAADLATLQQYEGMSIFGEALAASGIIGFIPFVLFVLAIVFKPWRLSNRIPDELDRHLLRGMVVSLVFLLAVLQLNQNILRLYLWLHIAVLAAVYFVVHRSTWRVHAHHHD